MTQITFFLRHRGSFTSAVKAYEKVLSLGSSQKKYAELQIATIKLKLGQFRDAKSALENLLTVEPQYVPGLKIMAECLLNEAREYLVQAIDKNAVDNCQQAISHLVQAIVVSPK